MWPCSREAEYKAVAPLTPHSNHKYFHSLETDRLTFPASEFSNRLCCLSSYQSRKMSGCGNDKCTCGPSCNGCSCKKNMDDSMLTSSFECDSDGCSCSSCSNCAPSCGCTSCSSSH